MVMALENDPDRDDASALTSSDHPDAAQDLDVDEEDSYCSLSDENSSCMAVDISPSTDSRFRGSSTHSFTNYLNRGPEDFPIRRGTPVAPRFEELTSDGDIETGDELSPFESLPNEVRRSKMRWRHTKSTKLLQYIATNAITDLDLSRLTLSSPVFAERLNTSNADIWRRRFLLRYDYPILDSVHEFALAYKIRRLVLRKFDGRALVLGQRAKAMHQLLVMKDLILGKAAQKCGPGKADGCLETYNKAAPHLPNPSFSKNLAAMSSPSTSPWILKFMGCSLYGNGKYKYGRPDMEFDTIQVALSHLVLSQRSPVLLQLPTSRDNYDLAKVYNFNKPFALLLQRLPGEVKKNAKHFRNRVFPGLTASPPPPPRPQYCIDIHAVLHIRNFWQRHFSDDVQGIGENTYASSARSFVMLGKVPQKWNRPLQECIPFSTEWIGHYSCLHPWPKSRQDLEERQSCAEGWSAVDPMRLDLETSTSNRDGTFWPAAFSSIPAFASAMPSDVYHKDLNVIYLRGIAPFKEIQDSKNHKAAASETECDRQHPKLPKWHHFMATRVHGFVHDIPDDSMLDNRPMNERFCRAKSGKKEAPIPGWKRVIMIIYKPTTRQLVSILEHAEEDYGGPRGDFNIANIWEDNNAEQAQPNQDLNTSAVDTATTDETQTGQIVANEENDGGPTEEQVETRMKLMLTRRILSYTEAYNKRLEEQTQAQEQDETIIPPAYSMQSKLKPKPKALPPLFSAQHIRELEEAHSSAQYMTWDDGTIDYAYAYEGIVIPGGKIMLGRWWRIHGIEGMGPGKEVGPDGVGVEVRPVETENTLDSASHEDDSAHCKSKGSKRKPPRQVTRSNKRRKSKGKRKSHLHDTDDDTEPHEEDADQDYEDEMSDDGDRYEPKKEAECEFVTMVNGEESRAVNGCKDLERGPFVFWTH